MYEPIILRKRKSPNLAGTPAGKLNVCINLMLTFVPFAVLAGISWFLIKKKRIINELDGTIYDQVTIDNELLETRNFWKHHTNIVMQVLKRQQEKETQFKKSLSVSNPEIAESNN